MKHRFFLFATLLLTMFRPTSACGDTDFETARLKVLAVNPPGISLTLRLPDGRTQFHQGEVIPLTAIFASSLPKAYQLNIGAGDRELPWNSDSFQVDNPVGAVDPLRLHYGHVLSEAFSGGGPQFQDLDQQPVSVPYTVNEWLRFDAPGKYRVYLTSGRIVDRGRQVRSLLHFEGRDTTSNAVDLEILPDDPVWDARTLQQVLPLFNAEGFDPQKQKARQAAVRAVRFLGTPDAARAMIARYGHFADTLFWSSPAYDQTRLGLFGFPKPAVVIQEMECRLADPDFPVFNDFLYDLAQVQFFAAYSQPLPPYPAAEPKTHQWYALRTHLQAVLATLADQNRQTLAWAADTKRGKARAVSLYTLLQADYAHQGTPEHQELARALVPVFDDLTPEEQANLLGDDLWPLLRGPDMLPVLRRLSAAPPDADRDSALGYEAGQRQSLALRRLTELSPAEGRDLLLEQRGLRPKAKLPPIH
ncbi:MAG: hypothetical protein M3Y13_14165 [Armatimonadota bacterium]|nr:hypothetical protein [Armatimonadota bacterium]